MKNRTARTTMMKRTAGLILVPEEEEGVGVEEVIGSLWKTAPGNGAEEDEDKTGGSGGGGGG